jgi:Xaa-Pro aminopeptidase
MPSDRPAKVERLVAFLAERNAAAVALTRAESLSWLFDGARVTVPYGGAPVCSAVVDRAGDIVVTAHANEAERLRSEELGSDVAVQAVPWHRPLPTHRAAVLREEDHSAALRRLRARLLPVERERYARFAAELTHAVGVQLNDVSPAEREHDLAARLLHAVAALGAEPMVVLAAGEERTGIPHPLPTASPLGRRAMAVVGARRHGLVVNLTRWVSFAPSADAAATARALDLDARLREVEADAFAASRPGRVLGAVLADIADSYRRNGFGDAAWLAHHQGGPTGYLGRDPKATPNATDLVQSGQAFAWNPWVPGAKAEDTVIVDDDGIDVLTVDPAWPATPVRGIPRPLTLERD